jgi:putative MATE family efflux protein
VSSSSDDTITEGGLVRPMIRLAWPIVTIQLLQVAYNVADTFWLGRFSADAVGAMSIGFPIIFLLISVAGGFTAAGAILVAQYTGADSEGSAGTVAGQTLGFVTLLALALSALGYLFTGDLLALLPSQADTTQDVIPLAAAYMEVFFLGLPFLFGFFVFSALMRGYGDTRTPMRVMFLSVALNVVLDPILIFGWDAALIPSLGIRGAALATIISRGAASVLGIYILFFTHKGPDVAVSDLRLELEQVTEIVRIGVPSALEQSASAAAMLTLTAMVVTFAPAVVAAYGLGNRLVSVIFLPAMGLGRATNTMVGQNLGADQADRAERAVWIAAKASAGVMVVAAIVAAAVPEPIVGVFMATGTDKAAETVALGSQYLRIRSVEFAFIGVLQVLLGAFRGAGDTKTAMGFSIVALWLGRVPTVAYLALGVITLGPLTIPLLDLSIGPLVVQALDMGPEGIWIGMAMGNILGAIAAAAYFTRGTWKHTVIDDTPTPTTDGGDE